MTLEILHAVAGDPTADAPPVPGGATLARMGKDPRLLVHPGELLNVETPVQLLNELITPIERMFMRNNHVAPQIDPADWNLTIDGLVRRPLTIDLADLKRLPTSSYIAVLECSGNGRERFAADGMPTEGLQWRNGAVANAEWIGVPVALLLEQAGVKAVARQAECWSAGPEPFARGVELRKLRTDAMLAYAVNGQPIPATHGGPVRLVVPGWGGINWVKWITHMHLIAGESSSIYNQQNYVLYDAAGEPFGKVRELLVKSIFTNIAADAELSAGPHTIRGLAWSGGNGIAQVEFSSDEGATWQPTTLLADLGPRAWRAWACTWQATPGRHRLMARATDLAGNVQPLAPTYNTKGYQMNAVQQIPVHVRA
jgi:DMSO/TMAO reductase YedYZ molybdopterin-dependent catalytic subunit